VSERARQGSVAHDFEDFSFFGQLGFLVERDSL
jgi:hypothetical protein